MPKKGKKGKKAAAEEAARLEAEKAAADLEAKRKFEEELKAREQALLAREEAIAKREQDAQALETDFRSKLEGWDAEVTLRARSGIAAAEAREAATERRAKMREEEAAQREAVFREAETTMAVREVEVAAREAAMGENVIGGVAARLDAMLSDQAISRDQMTQRKKEIAKEREALKLREQAWRDEVLKMEVLTQRLFRPFPNFKFASTTSTRPHESLRVSRESISSWHRSRAGHARPEGARRPRKGGERGAQAHAEGLYP